MTTWDYSVYVDKDLNANHLYSAVECYTLVSKKREKEFTPLTPAESLTVLVEHTGLRYLRMYYPQEWIYISLPRYNCYFKITSEALSVMVSRIFLNLSLPAKCI